MVMSSVSPLVAGSRYHDQYPTREARSEIRDAACSRENGGLLRDRDGGHDDGICGRKRERCIGGNVVRLLSYEHVDYVTKLLRTTSLADKQLRGDMGYPGGRRCFRAGHWHGAVWRLDLWLELRVSSIWRSQPTLSLGVEPRADKQRNGRHRRILRSDMLKPASRHRRAVLTGTITAVVVCAGVAIASTTGTPDEAISPTLRERFETFRAPETSADTVPAAAQALLRGGRPGAERDLAAARVFSSPTGDGWVIPAKDNVCIAVPDPVDGFGLTCSTTGDEAASVGQLAVLVDSKRPQEPTVSALVPDDGRVIIKYAGGRSADLKRTRGVASIRLDEPESVTIQTPRGSRTMRLDVPLPSVPTTKDCGDGKILPASETCP